jgi:hypothetical protein
MERLGETLSVHRPARRDRASDVAGCDGVCRARDRAQRAAGPPDAAVGTARSPGPELADGIDVIDPEAKAEHYVAALIELRRHRGGGEQVARDHLTDRSWSVP